MRTGKDERRMQKELDAFDPGNYNVQYSKKGNQGIVFFVEDRTKKKIVAVKKPISRKDEEGLSDIFENMVESGIKSPYVIEIYGAPKVGDIHFLFMECLDDDLESLLEEEGRLREKKALDITLKLSQGLSAIHEKGYMHRDLQKRNILFTRDGIPKIADFGLIQRKTYKETSKAKGTIQTAAPEQIIRNSKDNKFHCYFESDIYSIASLLYEMIEGIPPFPGEEDEIKKHKQEKSFIKNLSAKHIREDVMLVIRKGLHPDHKERYRTVGEIIEDLELLYKSKRPKNVGYTKVNLKEIQNRIHPVLNYLNQKRQYGTNSPEDVLSIREHRETLEQYLKDERVKVKGRIQNDEVSNLVARVDKSIDDKRNQDERVIRLFASIADLPEQQAREELKSRGEFSNMDKFYDKIVTYLELVKPEYWAIANPRKWTQWKNQFK